MNEVINMVNQTPIESVIKKYAELVKRLFISRKIIMMEGRQDGSTIID